MNNRDFFDKTTLELKEKKLFLFDMDGTIYNENVLFDGAKELFEHIKSINGKYVFITNNSSKSVTDYIEKLKKMGIPVDETNFFTSTQATILYLKDNYPNELVYCQGTKSFISELNEANIKVTESVNDDARVVLVGFDTEMTSEKIRNTCEMLQKNVCYIATNPDLACPVSFGFIPDCGSICGMIKNATGKEPLFIGKPQATMVEYVMKKYGYSKNETCVVGDRLYTDILSGLNAHVSSIAVLTGEATEEAILNGEIKPTFTFKSIKELWQNII